MFQTTNQDICLGTSKIFFKNRIKKRLHVHCDGDACGLLEMFHGNIFIGNHRDQTSNIMKLEPFHGSWFETNRARSPGFLKRTQQMYDELVGLNGMQFHIIFISYSYLVGGLNPSEKYESQLG